MSEDPRDMLWVPYIAPVGAKQFCEVRTEDGRGVVGWPGFDGIEFQSNDKELATFIAQAPAMYRELTRLLDVVSPSDRERIAAVLQRAKGETTNADSKR